MPKFGLSLERGGDDTGVSQQITHLVGGMQINLVAVLALLLVGMSESMQAVPKLSRASPVIQRVVRQMRPDLHETRPGQQGMNRRVGALRRSQSDRVPSSSKPANRRILVVSKQLPVVQLEEAAVAVDGVSQMQSAPMLRRKSVLN